MFFLGRLILSGLAAAAVGVLVPTAMTLFLMEVYDLHHGHALTYLLLGYALWGWLTTIEEAVRGIFKNTEW